MKISKLKKQRRANRSRGVAAVEFAIVAPLLLLILFMMIESSRYLTALHATTGAAREAVRLTAVAGGDSQSVTDLAKKFMEQSSFKTESVAVTVETTDSGVAGMQTYTAVVSIDYSDVSVIGDPFNFSISKVRGYSAMLAPPQE